MPIEVELKARRANPDATIARLCERAPDEPATYRDTYFDLPDRRLENGGRQELRLRAIETSDATRRLWTYEGAMLNATSTPEFETTVGEPQAAHAILTGLGLVPMISHTEQCANCRLTHDRRAILATIETIPEIDSARPILRCGVGSQ